MISHNHFDHFAYVVNLIEAVKERGKSRSFPLLVILPASLFQYYTSLYQSQLQSMPVRFVPITDALLRQSTPLSFFHPTQAVMASFNSSQASFNSSQAQFSSSQAQFSSSQAQFSSSQNQLNSSQTQLNTSQTQLNTSQTQLNTSQTQLNTSQTQVQLLQNLSIRFVRNNHNSQSYAVVRCLLRA